jgi:hypothetical protein
MQISLIAPPEGIEQPCGYAPMDIGIEILIGPSGQIGPAILMPTELDGKTRRRVWLPDLPRTSGVAAILGSDKLDYYHPTRKPSAYAAMLDLLAQFQDNAELQWIVGWMQSESPLELGNQISQQSAADLIKLEGSRIVWRLIEGGYIHDLPAIQNAHEARTLSLALAGGSGELMGPLPKIHSKRLATPLLGCNDAMFCAWGQGEKEVLNVSAEMALVATRRYSQLLESKGHHIRLGDGKYWIWGALPEMAAISEATKNMAMFFGSEGADLDPVQALLDLINQVQSGAKNIGKVPENIKIACGYIGLGGSGIGRAAIGQMTELSTLSLLTNLLTYHQRQRRYVVRSTPYWVFGSLAVAEGSSKGAIAKSNEQIFEAMISGGVPPAAITDSIVQRLKIEGIPNSLSKKSNRQWAQLAYLAWLAPTFAKVTNNIMKPETTPENLLAWHVGRIFAACKSAAYYYAERGGKPSDDWKNPMDAYRQTLFSSPAQGFTQIVSKVIPYLTARPDKAIWYDRALTELGEDCPNKTPPKRWTDEQAFFLALGISQVEVARTTKKAESEPVTAD